jgi:hypothetical protein
MGQKKSEDVLSKFRNNRWWKFLLGKIVNKKQKNNFNAIVLCISLQGILSIPIEAFVTCVQINHFCNYRCKCPLWHLVKMTCSHINNHKMVCSCIRNLYLRLMSIWMKWRWKIHLYHPFFMSSQNRWNVVVFVTWKVVQRLLDTTWHLFKLICNYKS